MHSTVTVLIKAPLKNNYGPLGALTLERKKFLRGRRRELFGEAPSNWRGKFACHNAEGAMTRL